MKQESVKVSKGAKIRNRYHQVPHLTKDTNGKVTLLQLDTTNESQEVSPFPAGHHQAQINRRAQRHNKHKTEKHINDLQKNTVRPNTVFGTLLGIMKQCQKIERNMELISYWSFRLKYAQTQFQVT